MGGCAADGGCPSDFVAISISAVSLFLLLARLAFPFLFYKLSIPKGSAFWIPATQILASFGLLASVVMSVNLIKIEKRHWWQSCYVWAVIHVQKPLNYRCQMTARWVIPVVSLHSLYVVILVGFTRSIRHVDFRFQELKDLWRGVLVSTFSVGFWVGAYILNEIHDDTEWLQVASRFLLALMTSIFVLAFFSLSSSQPLLSQASLRRRERPEFETMGQALGISQSGILPPRGKSMADRNLPLDKLLSDKRFRQSLMAFADSCLAGESVHFYDEVHDLEKLPPDDSVRRIYMARHIIQQYIIAGKSIIERAPMEVNISHRTRQEILNTADLAHPDLFKSALTELLHLMQTNLARDYWSSSFYMKFREEAEAKANGYYVELGTSWNVSPRLSSIHAADDPFHQDHLLRGSSNSHDFCMS
ncbi:hypothetical protein Cgig2_024666 [Carnegiea gigantea]|uniref:RGS domain-containing protein n=1 Tax=Carnegiea gigantea TaxID=171969 RepID=A0A9Q1K8D9_9CARY|nr:hypothetical protein Cgig2_024666 [Carnegiea gigantea]